MTWLSLKQVCALTRWRSRHVRRIATRDKWQTQISESRGRNGKHEHEYLLISLPADAQARFVAASRTAITKSSETLPLFSASQQIQQSPRIALGADQLKEAERKNAVLLAVEDWANGTRSAALLADGRKVSTKSQLVKWLSVQHGLSESIIWIWLGKKKDGGVIALARKLRKDKGQSKLVRNYPEAVAFLENKYLHEGLSCQVSWDALVREWPKMKKKGKPPSYATVRRHLGKLPEPLKVLAREGKQAHWSKCSPFVQRGPVPVMEWWVSDHRRFDVIVRNTLFNELAENKAFRIWITAIYDWGSRNLVGFCLAPSPSSRTINSALRMAILAHGMPRNFYWDNGEDYKKVRRDLEAITLSSEAESILNRNQVSVTSALPFHPRSKPIESWFSRWSKRFDPLWRGAYVGNSPSNRPEFAIAAQKQHGEYLKGKRADSPLPTDMEFIAGTVQFALEDNDTRFDTLNGRTPNEMMEEQNPARNRQAVNPRLLDILFSERVTRTVQAGGDVQIDRMAYEPTEASLLAMDALKGRQVIILRDPFNLTEAVAADPETMQFVGELHIKPFVEQSANGRITRDQIKANMRRQRSVAKGYAAYLAGLQVIQVNRGWKTEREALLERAGMRTGTDNLALAVAPGAQAAAQLPPSRAQRVLQPAFVSDAVAEDADIFKDLKVED